ncbi:hypothetical protein GJ699_23220 [Duganella sp. FT80W]|uniref:Uncharacterized protein n=1 Tax=Duganella guangzhouensis TaxID=2666084 RepID=A0A6I2L564_9BURK|nr:hypothetical protein [Duganella guangzhouensis]MRW92913.1 hypothetical protein [Duganella guangzhouensis]
MSLSRAIELSIRGAELLADSNGVLRRIAELSHRATQANQRYAQLLLDWSSKRGVQHELQSAHDRKASLEAATRIAQRATRAALDIATLVDGRRPAWLRGIERSPSYAQNLTELFARLATVTAEVERLARRPAPHQHELEVLAHSLQGMRKVSRQNIEVGKRSIAGIERIQSEAMQFVRVLRRG